MFEGMGGRVIPMDLGEVSSQGMGNHVSGPDATEVFPVVISKLTP